MSRDKELIWGSSPCDRDYYTDESTFFGWMLSRVLPQRCPNYDSCYAEDGSEYGGYGCAMRLGHQAAVRAILEGRSVSDEVYYETRKQVLPRPRTELSRAYHWSADRRRFVLLTRAADVLEAARDFAVLVLEGTLEDDGAAYRVPAQAETLEMEAAGEGEPMVVTTPDGEEEFSSLTR